jgi:hypothetical protein
VAAIYILAPDPDKDDLDQRTFELEASRLAWLRHLHTLSSKSHSLVPTPDLADIIFVLRLTRSTSEIVSQYPEKCFAVDENDNPSFQLRGIYASNSARAGPRGHTRFRTGCYQLYPRTFSNPFVEESDGRSWSKEKRWLASFLGRRSHGCRDDLIRSLADKPGVLVKDTSDFDLFNAAEIDRSPQKVYRDILESSEFALCPRGTGTGSIRLFEAMRMGVAPVIISDSWILPQGPMWHEFALFSREDSATLLEDLRARRSQYAEMGRLARKAWETFFSDTSYFDLMVRNAMQVRAAQFEGERIYWRARHLLHIFRRIRVRLKVATGFR